MRLLSRVGLTIERLVGIKEEMWPRERDSERGGKRGVQKQKKEGNSEKPNEAEGQTGEGSGLPRR